MLQPACTSGTLFGFFAICAMMRLVCSVPPPKLFGALFYFCWVRCRVTRRPNGWPNRGDERCHGGTSSPPYHQASRDSKTGEINRQQVEKQSRIYPLAHWQSVWSLANWILMPRGMHACEYITTWRARDERESHKHIINHQSSHICVSCKYIPEFVSMAFRGLYTTPEYIEPQTKKDAPRHHALIIRIWWMSTNPLSFCIIQPFFWPWSTWFLIIYFAVGTKKGGPSCCHNLPTSSTLLIPDITEGT